MGRKKKDEYGIHFFEELYEAMISPEVWKRYNNREDYFDYPDYGGLPKRISNKLSSEVVDFLQENQGNDNTKKQFYHALKAYCFPLTW